MAPFIPTTESHEAGVAAALAGAVVVLLGYASGLGVRVPAELRADGVAPAAPVAPQAQVPATVSPQPTAPLPTPSAAAPSATSHEHTPVPESPAAPHDQGHPSATSHEHTPVPESPAAPQDQGHPAPTAPTAPTALTEPEPAPGCQTGLIDGLPVIGPLAGSLTGAATDAVTSTLQALLALPLVSGTCSTTETARTEATQ